MSNAKSGGGYTDYLRLRVPESEKTKEWYQYQADRIIPAHLAGQIEDYDELDKLYRFMGNDFSLLKDEIDYYCGSLEDMGATEEELRGYNPIPGKLDVLEGEVLAKPVVGSKPSLLTRKAMYTKTEEFKKEIEASVDQELSLLIESMKLEQQGLPPEQIQQMIQEMRTRMLPQHLQKKNFSAQGEITFGKILQSAIERQGVKDKKLETLKDLEIGARLFIYCGWKYGRPHLEVLNTKQVGFYKSPNEKRVEKGDYVFYRDKITVGDAIQEYGNHLSEADLEKLVGDANFSTMFKDQYKQPIFSHLNYYSILAEQGGHKLSQDGNFQGNSTLKAALDRLVDRVHCEFKAFEPVIFVSYKNEYGVEITEKVPSNTFVVPKNADRVEFTNKYFERSFKWMWVDEITGVEYSAESLWIPRRHEFTILESDILTLYRKVPFQPEYHENPFADFELSYKGRIVFNRNTKWLSPVLRAMPYAFQYMVVKRLQDRLASQYVGHEVLIDLDQVPSYVGKNHEAETADIDDPVLRNDIIARKTGKRYYSGSNTTTGMLPQSTRTVGAQHAVVDTSMQMLNLRELSRLLDEEVGMALGVPPGRQGIVTPGTNVSDNRQALVQHTLATQTIFHYLDQVWNCALDEHMKNELTYIQLHMDDNLGYSLESMLPDGSKEFLKVLPKDIEFMRDLGLSMYSNGKEQLYFDLMTQQVFSIAQNGGEGAETISSILKALVTSSTPEEVHDMIAKASSEQQNRVAEMQKQEAELKQKSIDDLLKLEKYRADLKLEADKDKIVTQGAIQLKVADIQASLMERQADIDRDGENDQVQRDAEQQAFEAKENQKDRDLQWRIEKLKASKPSTKSS